jgi:hypothetical protein
MRFEKGDVLPLKYDLTGCGTINTTDYVEQSRFPSTIRANEAPDLALVDVQAQILYGL